MIDTEKIDCRGRPAGLRTVPDPGWAGDLAFILFTRKYL